MPLRATRRLGLKRPSQVIVFLREPRAGLVKTRLASAIGARQAARLYRAFVQDTLHAAASLSGADLEVRFTPSLAKRSRILSLAPRGSRRRWVLRPQSTGGLGERLSRAARDAFRQGAASVILLGSDCPLLGSGELKAADNALRRNDVVLGPARDGGYYLIGLSRPAPGLFRNVPWSTPEVLGKTLERAEALGLTIALLRELPDVDTLGDLIDLRSRLCRLAGRGASVPRATHRAVEAWARGGSIPHFL